MSAHKDAQKNDAEKLSERNSSHGKSPVEMIPKDVTPEDASWKDRTERDITSDNEEIKQDALLDEASELSFPASDPIAVSSPTKLVKDKDGNLHPAAEQSKDQK